MPPRFFAELVILVGVFLGGVAWAFTHLERVDILLTWLYRAFSWLGRSVKLRAVASQIQSGINPRAEAIEAEVQGVLPHPITIRWLGAGEDKAYLDEGSIVVCMRNRLDDERNVAAAIRLYLSQGLLRESRPFLEPRLAQAIDLIVTWRLVGRYQDTPHSSYFLNNVYTPATAADPMVHELCGKLDTLDARGLLTRVHLRELRDLHTRARAPADALPSRDVMDETLRFTDFIHTIATSEPRSKYPLQFIGRAVKTGVLLVARWETLAASGLRVHKHWLRRKVESGAESVYIIASGPNNVDLARHVAQWAQTEQLLEIVRSQTFRAPYKTGEPQLAIVITCHSRAISPHAILSPDEQVHAVLARYIPEIASGQVEVIDIAREVGIQSKVVIRSTSILDPAASCARYVPDIVHELNESIWFVPWSDDPTRFVISCIGTRADNIVSVQIDQGLAEATVVVSDDRTRAIAIGSKGANIRNVAKITGLRIHLITQSQLLADTPREEEATTPEDELRRALAAHIPEVASDQIEIVDLVRDPGVQSKIVIRARPPLANPVAICVGPRKSRLNALMDLLGERVFFAEHNSDPIQFLVNCLNIFPRSVLASQHDAALSTATILVRDSKTAAMAVGESGINVRQAALLAGFHRVLILHPDDPRADSFEGNPFH